MTPTRTALLVIFMLAAAVAATAQDARDAAGLYAPTVWDLTLGAHASELKWRQYTDFACGTDGGPPSLLLGRFTDYARCPKNAAGLHEVYFEYDDELEYIARAKSIDSQLRIYEGTTAYGLPILVSALFDEIGFLVGVRLISDPRAEVETRERGAGLSAYLAVRFGEDRWHCIDLPRLDGETPYRNALIKRSCVQDDGRVRLVLETHNYRKPGQAAVDPVTRRPTVGQFESVTRFEMVAPVLDGAARLADVRPLPPTDVDVLAARIHDCAGCDLRGAQLKGADLRNANLVGADLSGANLHAALLDGANLRGTRLANANLNRAEIKRADLTGADLTEVMLVEARLNGSTLAGADLTGALARNVQLIGAQARAARFVETDMRNGRLNDVDFRDADLSRSWLMNAQMARTNLAGARLEGAVVWDATLTQANLSGAIARDADFSRANLRGADLTAADLTNARLTQANLAEVTLDRAILEGAQLPAGYARPER